MYVAGPEDKFHFYVETCKWKWKGTKFKPKYTFLFLNVLPLHTHFYFIVKLRLNKLLRKLAWNSPSWRRWSVTSIFILISLFRFLCYISIFVLDLLCVLCILLWHLKFPLIWPYLNKTAQKWLFFFFFLVRVDYPDPSSTLPPLVFGPLWATTNIMKQPLFNNFF